MDPKIQVNVGNLKVLSLSGSSTIVVGKGNFKNVSSHSKTNNGVGNAYGDGSHINMSSYQSPLNDSDMNDNIMETKDRYMSKHNEYEEEQTNTTQQNWNREAFKNLRF